jgi:hypothetical protein
LHPMDMYRKILLSDSRLLTLPIIRMLLV